MSQTWERNHSAKQKKFRVSDNSDDALGRRFSSQLAAAGSRISCRSRSKHGEIAGDAKKKTLRYVVSGYDTILKSTSESTDRENVHGDIITVGTECFRWTGFTTSSF